VEKENLKNSKKKEKIKEVKEMPKQKTTNNINIDKLKNVAIIVLSLIIVFGLAFVVPELKNCGTCSSNQIAELTNITIDIYREILASDEVSLIYIASPSCGYCAQQEPIMQELVSKYDFEVNYLNTNSVTSTDMDEVYKLYGSVQESLYGVDGVRTPTILIVQSGKLLDMQLGNIDLESLVALLQQYTTVKE